MAKRLDRYARGVGFTAGMVEYLETRDPRRSQKAAGCARLLQFRNYVDTSQSRLVGGYFCQQWKLCLTCAIRRGGKVHQTLWRKAAAIIKAKPWLRMYLVTLTTLNGPDSKERFDHLQNSLRLAFNHRRDAMRAKGHSEFAHGAGIFAATEGGLGANSGEWHWHAHLLWIGSRPSYPGLKAEWEAITGDSSIVDVKELKCSKARDFSDQALGADLLEVCKYVVKPHELTREVAYTAHVATAGRHFTRTLGYLRFSAEETAELEAVDDQADAKLEALPHFDRLFAYRARAYGGRRHDHYVELGRSSPLPDELLLIESRAVNHRCTIAELIGRRRNLITSRIDALLLPRGEGPALDTRVKIADARLSGTPPDPGPPPLSKALRFDAPPTDAECAFDLEETPDGTQPLRAHREKRRQRAERRAAALDRCQRPGP